jgi:cytochrome b involved in lipid metabolism
MSEQEYELSDVAQHKTEEDCWIAVGGKVYDVTKFLDDHPGGPEIILDVAGTEATEEFEDVGHSDGAREQLEEHLIGTQKGYVAPEKPEAAEGCLVQ